MTLAPGTTVGRYQILEPLGQGGMATVYKAFQPSLEREVALKVLRPGFAQDAEFRERFEREAKSIARLRHPNVVQVFDFEVTPSGEFVLAMEFLDGGTLKDRIAQLAAKGRGVDPTEAVRILWEVADALSYAHEQGIVHRDVKPSNVMLARPRARAVVTDFGIARILGATSHTQTGVGIGTPEYMAPEQGQGGKVDHRADIYSLGAMAYELLTGRVPYTADTPLAVVIAHIKDPLRLPSKVNPTIGPNVERALLKALAKDPAARYDTALAFAEALKAGLAEDTKGGTMPTVVVRGAVASVAAAPAVRPAPTAPRPSTRSVRAILADRPIVTGVAGALVLALVISGVVLSSATRTQTPPATAPSSSAAATAQLPSAGLTTGAPKFAIPAKGPLLWEAKLDASGTDISPDRRGQVGDQDAISIRQVPGAIELAVTKPVIGWISSQNTFANKLNGTLAAPRKGAYVAELDLSFAPGSDVEFQWTLKNRRTPFGLFFIEFDPVQEQVSLNCGGADCPTQGLTGAAVSGLAQGRTFTVAAAVSEKRIALYVDQKRVADADASAITDVTPAVLSIAGPHDVPGKGTVKIVGARFYELPTASAPSASAAVPEGQLPPPPTGTGRPTIVTAAPGIAQATSRPAHAVPSRGAVLYEAKLDGVTQEIQNARVFRGSASDATVRYVPGAIELSVQKADTAVGGTLRAPSRASYVLEFDLSTAPDADVAFSINLRNSGGQPQVQKQYGIQVRMDREEVFVNYWDQGSGQVETVIDPVPVPGIRSGRPTTVAVVLDGTRFALYIDERLVGEATHTAFITNTAAPFVGVGAEQGQAGGGVVRILSMRMYDVR